MTLREWLDSPGVTIGEWTSLGEHGECRDRSGMIACFHHKWNMGDDLWLLFRRDGMPGYMEVGHIGEESFDAEKVAAHTSRLLVQVYDILDGKSSMKVAS